VVFPTGGGKTLTFTLPAVPRDPGVSIVVAPFNALEKDYVRRLRLAKWKSMRGRAHSGVCLMYSKVAQLCVFESSYRMPALLEM
jgi:hypothetical protein